MTTMDKAGIGVTIGVLAVVMVIGVGSTSGVSIFDGFMEMEEKPSTPVTQEKPSTPVIQEKPSMPVIQEKPSTPVIQKASSIPMVNAKSGNASYISSTGDVIDHLDFKISEGDVKSMHLDK